MDGAARPSSLHRSDQTQTSVLCSQGSFTEVPWLGQIASLRGHDRIQDNDPRASRIRLVGLLPAHFGSGHSTWRQVHVASPNGLQGTPRFRRQRLQPLLLHRLFRGSFGVPRDTHYLNWRGRRCERLMVVELQGVPMWLLTIIWS